MYVITGATGRTGSRIVHRLLDGGEPVRAIGRSEARLRGLVERGAEPAVGDLRDAAFVRAAFDGASAAYAMIPPAPREDDLRAFQDRIAENLAEALLIQGVEHVVTLSSIGAEWDAGTGVVLGLHDLEQKLNAIPHTAVLHLRAACFMENLFAMIPQIRATGHLSAPLRPDTRFPIVATRDIAEVAADALSLLDFEGKRVQYVLGAEDTTYPEIARILGEAIGRPGLTYRRITFDDARDAMVEQWGVSEDAADLTIEFLRALDDGRILENVERTPEATTPTSLRDFAPSFAQAYRAAERQPEAAD